MNDPNPKLSFQDLQQIDALVDRFEDAWLRDAAPRIGDFLGQLQESSQLSSRRLLVELVVIDLAHLWRRDELSATTDHSQQSPESVVISADLPTRPKVEDYLRVFPKLVLNDEVPCELVIEEYRARRRCDERPDHDEYLRRFPRLAPKLESELLEIDRQFDPALGRNAGNTDQVGDTVRPSSEAALQGSFRLCGDYEMLNEIASGGMGIVYKARHVKLNRIAALKMIKSGSLASHEEVRRFHIESKAAAALDHPHIVPVFEVGQHDGQHFLAMGFVDGVSLAKRLSDGPLPPREAAELIGKIATAMDHAHQHGVIHRDLKPGNILLDAAGEPHITDFGLAKQVDSGHDVTMTGQILGTPSFMAPEQAAGRTDIGPAVDIYAMGALLYNALTGRPPFQADNVIELLRQVNDEEPLAPRLLNPRLHRDLETICLKAMSKSPDRRYASAAILADDLKRFLAGQPIHARPVTAFERSFKWVRRHPAQTIGAAMGLIALMALVGLAVAYQYQEELRATNQSLGAAKGEIEEKAEQLAEANKQLEGSLRREIQLRQELAAKKEETDQSLYFRHVDLALSKWNVGDVVGARKLLDECPAERRDWEWHYAYRICHPEAKTLSEHEGAVTCVAFSPKSRLIATSSADGTVRVWDIQSGQAVHTLKKRSGLNGPGYQSGITSVDFSSDGQWIASGSSDNTVTLWNVERGVRHRTFHGHTAIVNSVAFSPDGKQIASASDDGSVKLWDTSAGSGLFPDVHDAQQTLESGTQYLKCVAFSPDGKRLGAGGGLVHGGTREQEKIFLWDAETGELIRALSGHDGIVSCISFSPNGEQFASGGTIPILRGNRNDLLDILPVVLVLWDTMSGQRVREFNGYPVGVLSVGFSPDGKRIVAGGNNSLIGASGADEDIKVWDASTGIEIQSLRGHASYVSGVTFSTDGKWIASASADNTVKLWSALNQREYNRVVLWHKAGAPLGAHEYQQDFDSRIAFHPDGRRVVGGWSKGVQLWDPDDDRHVYFESGQHASEGTAVAIHPDGRMLASGSKDTTVKLWDMDTRQVIRTLGGHTEPVNDVTFSPDGTQLASASEDGNIILWNTSSGETTFTLVGHAAAVKCIAFNAAGTLLASGSIDGTMRVWNAPTGQLAFAMHFKDDPARWDVERDFGALNKFVNERDREEMKRGMVRLNYVSFQSVTFSPNGALIAAAGDEQVKVWNTKTQQKVLTLPIKPGEVGVFHQNGRRIITSGVHPKIWDVATGREVLLLTGNSAYVRSLAVTPDGQRIIGSGSRTTIWDARSGQWPDDAEKGEGHGDENQLKARVGP